MVEFFYRVIRHMIFGIPFCIIQAERMPDMQSLSCGRKSRKILPHKKHAGIPLVYQSNSIPACFDTHTSADASELLQNGGKSIRGSVTSVLNRCGQHSWHYCPSQKLRSLFCCTKKPLRAASHLGHKQFDELFMTALRVTLKCHTTFQCDTFQRQRTAYLTT